MFLKSKQMKQGTVSVLLGCHSPIHSILVIISWKKLYNKWPKFWQLICIVFHDIGHYGLDYLDNYEEKKIHWILGARIAQKLFGDKGYDFCSGHCLYSGAPLSDLYKADKYSWYIAPRWWLISNNFFEPKLQTGFTTNREAVDSFRAQVKVSVESGEFVETHNMYLNRYR